MRSHLPIHLLIYVVVVILSTNKAQVNNFDDDGEEITMKHFLPYHRELSASEEKKMTRRLDENIQKANLSTLLKMIKWTSGLQEELAELVTNVTEKGIRRFHGVPLLGSTADIRAFVDETIDFLKGYEEKIENELRKPNKEWNYPTKDRTGAVD